MYFDGLKGSGWRRYSPEMRISYVLAILVAGCVAVEMPAKEKAAKPAPVPQTTAELMAKKSNKEQLLQQGMPAAEVLKLLGKPGEVKPMEAPTGKAEVWVYTTREEVSRERFEVASHPITTLVRDREGTERTVVIGHEPVYATQKRILVRTYQVLMFNDHFLNDKITIEEVRETL